MDPKEDEDAAGHADRKTEQIGGGKPFVPKEVSPGYLEVIL
jgi:hypothetical protein